MTDNEITERPTSAPARDVISLRIGGVCAIVGAIAFATFRTLHGDTRAPTRMPH